MLAITTIGAGGGLHRLDRRGGLLRMGPRSAGALPRARLLRARRLPPHLHRRRSRPRYLDPEFFAGGKLKLSKELAQKAIVDHLCEKLGLTLVQAAAGMYRVICSNNGARRARDHRQARPRSTRVPAGRRGRRPGALHPA